MSRLFHFNNLAIATQHHIAKRLTALNWQFTAYPERAQFNDKSLALKLKPTEQLEFKHTLAALCDPIRPMVHPLTYAINEENRDQVLATIFLNHYCRQGEYQTTRADWVWIVKPSLINNGNDIFVFHDFDSLRAFFMSSERLGGPHIIQRYIHQPDLWENRKYTFRMSMIVTNFAGVFLYPDGYLNCSGYDYDVNSSNKEVHVTNYFLEGKIPKVTQYFTDEYEGFDKVLNKITIICQKVIKRLLRQYPFYLWPATNKAFEIIGVDFMLDQQQNCWLLEFNQGPDFPIETDHALNEALWDPFWQAVVSDFVLPMGKNSKANYAKWHPVLSRAQTLPGIAHFT